MVAPVGKAKLGRSRPRKVDQDPRCGILVTVSRRKNGKVRVSVDRVVRVKGKWKTWGMLTYQEFKEYLIPDGYFHFLGWLAVEDAACQEFGETYRGQMYSGEVYRSKEELERIEQQLQQKHDQKELRPTEETETDLRRKSDRDKAHR